MKKKILDFSKYNVVQNWEQVAQSVDGIILRCGYRGYSSGKIVKDPKFEEFSAMCKLHKIPFGVYFMSQAITEAEGIGEADFAVKCANESGATLPVFIDSEDGDGTKKIVRADALSKRERTDVVKAFCNQVIAHGLKGGVYASESWFNDNLYYLELTDFLIWCAKYGKNTGEPSGAAGLSKVDMWQYTSKGVISGIQGDVDVNMCYNDFEYIPTIAVQPEEHSYIVGKNYILQNNMYVRSAPSGKKKYFLELTANAKSHAYKDASGFGILKKGTTVTCKGIENRNDGLWMKIPSGWVCAIGVSGKVYVK